MLAAIKQVPRATAAVAVAALVVFPVAANAANVSVGPAPPSGGLSGTTLYYRASAFEHNVLQIVKKGDTVFSITDSGAPITVGDGCSQTTPGSHNAGCNGSISSVLVTLEDQDDTASIVVSTGLVPPTTRLEGGDGSDQLRGDKGHDLLLGQGGRDFLYGEDSSDELDGGPGDGDFLDGGFGNDTLRGGDGILDAVDYEARTLRALGALATSVSTFTIGNDENDTVMPDVERVNGSPGNDSFAIAAGRSGMLVGHGGDDYLKGDTGGADILIGQDGDDTLQARDGVADRVDCGSGADTAVADLKDTLTDCEFSFVSAFAAGPTLTISHRVFIGAGGRRSLRLHCPRKRLRARCSGTLTIRHVRHTLSRGRYGIARGATRYVALPRRAAGRIVAVALEHDAKGRRMTTQATFRLRAR